MAARTVTKTLTVAGGVASGSFDLPEFAGSTLRIIAIRAPASAVYTWILRNAQGFALAGAAAASGDQTYYYDIPSLGDLTLSLSAATTGAYPIQLGVEHYG